MTPDDVVTLMALNTCCPEKCPEWTDYFIEQMAGFIVGRRELIAQINADA